MSLEVQFPYPATTPSWEPMGMMIMAMVQVRLTCSNATARAGRRKQSYMPLMERQVMVSESQSPSSATMPSWGLHAIVIMEVVQVRLICSNAPAQAGWRRQNYFLPMVQHLIFLEVQSPSPATTPSWELVRMMIMEIFQVRLICSNAPAQAGQRRQNYFLPMEQQVMSLEVQFPSPATTPSWELGRMMIMEIFQVRLICSNAPAPAGRRRRNYFLSMERQVMSLEVQSPSPATTPSWEQHAIATMEVVQVRLICSNVPAPAGRRRRSYSLPMEQYLIFLEDQSPSPATTPSWEHGRMMIMEIFQVRLICSNAPAQAGHRR